MKKHFYEFKQLRRFRNGIALLVCLLAGFVFAEDSASRIQSLDDLMKLVQQEKLEQRAEFKQRESRFRREKNKQLNFLKQAQAELKNLEKIQNQLIEEYKKHEKQLVELEGELNIIKGTLGELFGVVRQTAGDLKGMVLTSITSAQIKGRDKFLSLMVDRKKLPNIHELRRLWLELQREMTELGQVRQFNDFVVLNNGDKIKKQITRVGGFNLVSEGRYLMYRNETGQITELSKQPARRFLKSIDDLESATSTYSAFALDPSRGALLSVLLRVPSLIERIGQGGVVGYVIILLFFLGLGIVIYRWVILRREKEKIMQQIESVQPDEKTPIGRLRVAFEKHKHQDLETLELKLDEALLQSLPLFERGISTVKILAAVAPLMGLLGTVTGMILTFQSITLFGTGDPKLMAGGISQALITTVLGLCCAIPLLLLHNLISGQSKALIQILEEQTAGLIAKKIEISGQRKSHGDSD